MSLLQVKFASAFAKSSRYVSDAFTTSSRTIATVTKRASKKHPSQKFGVVAGCDVGMLVVGILVGCDVGCDDNDGLAEQSVDESSQLTKVGCDDDVGELVGFDDNVGKLVGCEEMVGCDDDVGKLVGFEEMVGCDDDVGELLGCAPSSCATAFGNVPERRIQINARILEGLNLSLKEDVFFPLPREMISADIERVETIFIATIPILNCEKVDKMYGGELQY
jgi:hypothetical protein